MWWTSFSAIQPEPALIEDFATQPPAFCAVDLAGAIITARGHWEWECFGPIRYKSPHSAS
jgi:hypothetical protein